MTRAITGVLLALVERRVQVSRWLYFVAAAPFLLFAGIGSAYGAFAPYAVLGLVCLIQALYPTLLGWGLVLGIFLTAVAIYGYALVADIARVLNHQHPQIFLNPSDTLGFVLLVTVLVAVSVGLLLRRPRRRLYA